jgi:3-mercaptopyruvate sulfurtransferase SseA
MFRQRNRRFLVYFSIPVFILLSSGCGTLNTTDQAVPPAKSSIKSSVSPSYYVVSQVPNPSKVVSTALVKAAEVKSKLEAGTSFVLIDIRSVPDYQSGHIPTAISIPFVKLPERCAEIPAGIEVIVYSACA